MLLAAMVFNVCSMWRNYLGGICEDIILHCDIDLFFSNYLLWPKIQNCCWKISVFQVYVHKYAQMLLEYEASMLNTVF